MKTLGQKSVVDSFQLTVSFILAIVLGTACSLESSKSGGMGGGEAPKKVEEKQEASAEEATPAVAEAPAPVVEADPAETVEVEVQSNALLTRTYAEIYSTFIALTEIDGNQEEIGNRSIKEYFDLDLSGALPATNDPSTLGAAGIAAVAKLAAEVCSRADLGTFGFDNMTMNDLSDESARTEVAPSLFALSGATILRLFRMMRSSSRTCSSRSRSTCRLTKRMMAWALTMATRSLAASQQRPALPG